MALLQTARGAQYVLESELVINWNDTMVEVGGVTKDMGAVTAGDVFKAVFLPPNSEIVGGEVQVEVAGVGPTAFTIEAGTSSDGTAANFVNNMLGVSDLKAAVGVTYPLVKTAAAVNPGLQSAVPNDVFIRLIRSVAVATAGKAVLRVQYILRGKINEAVPS